MPHQIIREENKKRVIEEATRMFMEIGVEKTTFEMIAASVGITKRSILNYYETKQELIMAVYKYNEKRQTENAKIYVSRENFQNMTGMEQLKDLMKCAMRHAIEHGDQIYKMERIQQYLMKEKVWDSDKYQMGSEILWQCMKETITKGKLDGSIREDSFPEEYDIEILLLSIIGVLRQIAFYTSVDDESAAKKMCELANSILSKFGRLSEAFFGPDSIK